MSGNYLHGNTHGAVAMIVSIHQASTDPPQLNGRDAHSTGPPATSAESVDVPGVNIRGSTAQCTAPAAVFLSAPPAQSPKTLTPPCHIPQDLR